MRRSVTLPHYYLSSCSAIWKLSRFCMQIPFTSFTGPHWSCSVTLWTTGNLPRGYWFIQIDLTSSLLQIHNMSYDNAQSYSLTITVVRCILMQPTHLGYFHPPLLARSKSQLIIVNIWARLIRANLALDLKLGNTHSATNFGI